MTHTSWTDENLQARCPHCNAVLDVRVRLQIAVPGAVLEEAIALLPISFRAYRTLKYDLKVETVGQLIEKVSKRDLIKAKNCGKKTIAEIEGILAQKGLCLREGERP